MRQARRVGMRWLWGAIFLNGLLLGLYLLPSLVVQIVNDFLTQQSRNGDSYSVGASYQIWIEIPFIANVLLFVIPNLVLLVLYLCVRRRLHSGVKVWVHSSERSLPKTKTPSVTARPEGRIKLTGTLPLRQVIGQKIVGLYAIGWSSEQCNLAQFILELGNGNCVTWDEMRPLHIAREFQIVELPAKQELITGVMYDNPNSSQVVGHAIVDILMPISEEDRHIESFVVELSSGIGLVQTTGEPIGILPALYVADIDRQGLISMLE